jgi:hypothetical protein
MYDPIERTKMKKVLYSTAIVLAVSVNAATAKEHIACTILKDTVSQSRPGSGPNLNNPHFYEGDYAVIVRVYKNWMLAEGKSNRWGTLYGWLPKEVLGSCGPGG